MLAASASCDSSPTDGRVGVGTAFEAPAISWAGVHPVKPGTEWVLLFAFLRNVSGSPVILRGVGFEGNGIGSVVTVFRVEVAPLPPAVGMYGFTPGGIFVTDPPAILLKQGRCNLQRLLQIDGYSMPPGGEARLAVFMRAKAPGQFSMRAHIVKYELDGQVYEQTLPVGMRGWISDKGGMIPLEKAQRDCLDAAKPLARAPTPDHT